MSALAVAHSYRYPFPSAVVERPGGARLQLAACGGPDEHPYFFEGQLLCPVQIAALLRGLVQVVQSRFYSVPVPYPDPIVTSNDDRLRFEGFSACGSAYARVDLTPDVVARRTAGRGTTNVDFNPPMLATLARLREGDGVSLAVGDAVKLEHAGPAVEKKVQLPVRWLKGLAEVHVYQPALELVHDLPGSAARRFLQALPTIRDRAPRWVVPAGAGLRLSPRAAPRAVQVAGVERLRVLQDLVRHARGLRIHADRESGTSAWELVLDGARFHLVLSPSPVRGFSGEGHLLATLAGRRWQDALSGVRAALCWQSVIDEAGLVPHRTGATAPANWTRRSAG